MPSIKKQHKVMAKKKSKKILNVKKSEKSSTENKYSSMTVDDFMKDAAENESGLSDDSDDVNDSVPRVNRSNKQSIATNSDSDSDELDDSSHAKSLNRLKNTDPEFYKFLQQNDKSLLQFSLSDDEESKDGAESDLDDADDTSDIHQTYGKLEVASDESDFEDLTQKTSESSSRVISLRMVKKWQEELQMSNVSIGVLGNVIKAFNAALLRVSSDDSAQSFYKIDGSAIFNAVVQLCVLHLQPAVVNFLKLTGSVHKPHKCKRWVKIKALLKGYFSDLLKLLGGVTSTNIRAVLLKHLHQMHMFVASFPNVSKLILKKLIAIWSTSDETVRVLAFLCILRVTRQEQTSLLDNVLKTMYITYVKNCKFVSPTTLPAINFMRRSLTEMFALDVNVSYPHVFLYIRQLAIHLRNAITLQKKQNMQTVYNWQFINSLHLWADLLALTSNKPQLQPLIYPLVMVILNTIKLIPTTQYFPLRFHCIQILINLSKNSGSYIPVLPLILEVLASYDFNQKHKTASLKPMQFTCILRVSKSQMVEHGFKDSVFENIYRLTLEALAIEAHSVAFPDLIVPCVVQIKSFLKKCHIASYCKQMRHILDKIEENAKVIENNRSKQILDLNNTQIINGWENDMKNKGLPLLTYYGEWKRVNEIQKKKKYTNNDEISDFKLPSIKKSIKRTATTGPAELFPSDSEDEDEVSFPVEKTLVEKTKSKRKKKASKNSDEDVPDIDISDQLNVPDIVENLNISEW